MSIHQAISQEMNDIQAEEFITGVGKTKFMITSLEHTSLFVYGILCILTF